MNDIYTFHAFDSYGDGWSFGSGYTLIQDDGEMSVEMEMLSSGATKPMSMSTVFSSCLPFHVEYTEWKVRQRRVPSTWNTVAFDDSAWSVTKAADIPSTQYPTTYIRKSFDLTGIEDYMVMNIRMKYTGGVAVYLNGNRLARFNLEEGYNAFTESISVRDVTVFSKFHIILSAAGVVEGTNVIAFEIYHFPDLKSVCLMQLIRFQCSAIINYLNDNHN